MITKNKLSAISYSIIIIFALVAVLCPLTLEGKTKRHQPKQEAVKQEKKKEETKEAPESVKKTDSEQEGVKTGETVKTKEAEKEETTGIPSKDFKDEDFKPQVEEESSVWMFIKMILVLGIFAGGFYYFYRFVTKKAGVSIFGGEAIKVLSVVPLGQNKFLHLIDVAGKVMVIGVSDNNISKISEITEKDQIDRIRILSTRTPPPNISAGGFHDQVMKEIGKIIGRVRDFRHRDRRFKATVIDNPADIEYLRQQRDRLKGLNGTDNE
jgi:Flagellar biogenesis protein